MQKRFSRFRLAIFSLAFGLFFTPILSAQDFVWAPEFPVGATMAEIAAQDQNGELREFADLVGDNGMLFMLSRSFDW